MKIIRDSEDDTILERDDGLRLDYAELHSAYLISLDGNFTREELEAIIAFMKDLQP